MKKWTNEEVEYVKTKCATMTDKDIAKNLGCDEDQVRAKRKDLGINKIRNGKSWECAGFNKKKKLRKKTYHCWYAMMRRCYNVDDPNWLYYGGRNIHVCPTWHTFKSFYEYMGMMPDVGYSIERIDVNGNYEPSNCVWIPKNVQQNNTTKSKYFTAWGETKTIADWFRDSRCKCKRYSSLFDRLSRGICPEDAISCTKKRRTVTHRRFVKCKTISKYITIKVKAFGEIKSIDEWVLDERCGKLKNFQVYNRLQCPDIWTAEDAISGNNNF